MLFHGDLAEKVEQIQPFKNLAILVGLLQRADQDSRGGRGGCPTGAAQTERCHLVVGGRGYWAPRCRSRQAAAAIGSGSRNGGPE